MTRTTPALVTPPARHRTKLGTVAVVALWALAVAACTGGSSSGLALDDGETADRDGPAATDADADADAETCRLDALGDATVAALTGPDPVAVSVAVAGRTHRCAEVVVVAAADDPWAAGAAAAVAVEVDGPLLLSRPGAGDDLSAELERLAPTEVVTVGLAAPTSGAEETTVLGPPPPPADGPPSAGTDGPPGDDEPTGEDGAGTPGEDTGGQPGTAPPALVPARELALAQATIERVGATELLAVPVDDHEARMGALARLGPGRALLPLPPDGRWSPAADDLPGGARLEVVASDPAVAEAAVATLVAAGVDAGVAAGPMWAEQPSDTVWVSDPLQAPSAAVAAVAATGRGEALLPLDLSDLRSGLDRTTRLRAAAPDRVGLVGEATEHADWQLPLVLDGPPLPGGGFRLFENERMVALYGHPISSVLGALGEQDLDATVERARRVAAPYGADGARVLPAFEVIATVASAEAGVLGDYSRRTAIDVLRPYVDRAADEGFYAVLDLQPGRTDFLTQAREYEELLLEPHVGLALDPEWRLEPNQVHMRQIGSVPAAEVQQVADWLAQLTRDNQLPEKLLILHQFQHRMLPDRDTIVAPPELAVVVHMDGQGPIPTKDETYRAITQGAEDRWLWGWKNFYDEDSPTPTPDHVLSRRPVPVFVSYQ
jgi:hypothetical protein